MLNEKMAWREIYRVRTEVTFSTISPGKWFNMASEIGRLQKSRIGKLFTEAPQRKPVRDDMMQKILIIFSMMVMAGCSSTGVETVKEHGVVAINSYLYEVAATRANGAADLEDVRQQVYTAARAFCAKQARVVETDSLTRLQEDLGRPASATLRFRCVESDQPQPPQKPQS